jgi:hypothetical protein
MATDRWVQGDTEPAYTATLKRLDIAEGLDTIQGVRFQMRAENDRHYTVNAPATVVDAALGKVKYVWGASDLNVPGEYLVQWEVTYASGRIETTDPPNTITVRRQ